MTSSNAMLFVFFSVIVIIGIIQFKEMAIKNETMREKSDMVQDRGWSSAFNYITICVLVVGGLWGWGAYSAHSDLDTGVSIVDVFNKTRDMNPVSEHGYMTIMMNNQDFVTAIRKLK